MSDKTENILKFRFDVSAYRLLGRELITDRITALFELVKNSYDGNSDFVKVVFESVSTISDLSKITIADDGIGMTLQDIKDKWMVIGTSSKRRERVSPPPYNRKVVGKKGVGRFAVDKLGARLLLRTKKKESDKVLCLITDWSFYEDLERQQLLTDYTDPSKKQQFFTDIENKYWFENSEPGWQGTSLEITLVNDPWTKNDIERACKELAKLISPAFNSKFPFKINLFAEEYDGYKNKEIKSVAIKFATREVKLSFDTASNSQQIVRAAQGNLFPIYVSKRPCGPVNLTLYYFDQKAKAQFTRAYPDERIDGVKIYRDGLIATPFAEYNENRDQQRDLFGIDKRRWSGFFDRLGTRDLIGWVEISDELNPGIIDATNRQDFVDNKQWQDLREFVIEQIAQVEIAIQQQRDTQKIIIDSELKEAGDGLGDVRRELNELIKVIPHDFKNSIQNIERQIARAQVSVNIGLKSKLELQIEKKQQEDLFFSLLSLQTFSSTLAHITRTIIGRIKRTAEFFKNRFPDPKYNDVFKKGAEKVFFEMQRLSSAIDFMLKYAKSDSTIEEVNLKDTLEHLFYDIHEFTFQQEGINTELIVQKEIILNYNRSAFEDIIENLVSNSIKALRDVKYEKYIKCQCIIGKDKLVILFSDNGPGIPEEDKYRIFDVFYTTTAEFGGAGMGLFIIKTRLDAIQGSIEVIENEFKPLGATFKITFPFKQ